MMTVLRDITWSWAQLNLVFTGYLSCRVREEQMDQAYLFSK
uniref:Uncharacterized protein n=1 Tax=Anguilla anguilla TaxID=7936 RepID=A0A0E9SRT9_ANGAN